MAEKNHIPSIFQALLVTFLWSTSFIIIKIGLRDITPLTFAGLRYFIAFLCLLPFLLTQKRTAEIKTLTKTDWNKLILLGLIFYSLTQGIQFIGLSLLPAVTVSLFLNFTPVIVAVMAIIFLSEIPSGLQWIGALLFIAGAVIYFFPADFSSKYLVGLIIMFFGVLSNAGSSILGRNINRKGNLSPLLVTIISMGIGSVILLVTAFITDGIPDLDIENTIYLLWLSVINTAFAFTLWNHILRTLSAIESSIINGTMLIQIALLAAVFLGEEITIKQSAGMFIAVCGAVLVQLKRKSFVKKT